MAPTHGSPAHGGGDRRLILVALITATFLVSLDLAVIATAMPTVVGQLGGVKLYSWVFAAYLLTSTVTVPIYGRLADIYGRKPIFFVATGLFLVGSALCGQAQSMEQLILFRVVQGVGAGGVLPVTVTIVGDIFPLEQRARITGVFSAIWGISALLGPAIGGFLTEQVSWRWVFYVNVPLSVLALILIGAFLHEQIAPGRAKRRIDYPGALLLSAAVTALLFGLRGEVGAAGDSAPGPLLVALALLLLAAFAWWERRAPEPMLPLALFRQRIIGATSAGGFLMGALLFSQTTFVPPFVQGVMGASPTVAGLVLAGTSLGWPLAATVAGRALLTWGYRPVALLGSAFLVAGFVLLVGLQPDDSLIEAVLIQVIIGLGFGCLGTAHLLAVQNAVSWSQRGVVTGAIQFFRSIGGTVGVSVAGALFAAGLAVVAAGTTVADPNAALSLAAREQLAPEQLAQLQSALARSFHIAYLFTAAAAVLTMLVSLLLPGGRAEEHAWREAEPDSSAPARKAEQRVEPSTPVASR